MWTSVQRLLGTDLSKGDQEDPRLCQGKAPFSSSPLGWWRQGTGRQMAKQGQQLEGARMQVTEAGVGGWEGAGTRLLSPTSCLCHGRAARGSPRLGSEANPRGAHTAHLWKKKRGCEPSQGLGTGGNEARPWIPLA